MLTKLYLRDTFNEVVNEGPSSSPPTYDLSEQLSGVTVDIGDGAGNRSDPVTVLRVAATVGDRVYSPTFNLSFVCTVLSVDTAFALRLVRLNSSGTRVADSGYGNEYTTTGTHTATMEFDTTWSPGDLLGIEFVHYRTAGNGVSYFGIAANHADSFVEASLVRNVEESLIPSPSNSAGGSFALESNLTLDIEPQPSTSIGTTAIWYKSLVEETLAVSGEAILLSSGRIDATAESSSTASATLGVIDVTTKLGSALLSAVSSASLSVHYTYEELPAYDSARLYDGDIPPQTNINLESVSSTSKGGFIDLPDVQEVLAAGASTSVSISFNEEVNSNIDVEPTASFSVPGGVVESIINYTNVSVGYNEGIYNDGVYEPVLGYGPEVYIDIAPSVARGHFVEVDAELFGYTLNPQSSFSQAGWVSLKTENNLDIESVPSSASGLALEHEIRYAENISTASSNTGVHGIDVKTDNRIDLETSTSSALGHEFLGGGRTDVYESLQTSTSTSRGNTVEWSLGQNLEIDAVPSTAIGYPVTAEYNELVLLQPLPSTAIGRFPAAVGGIQDRLQGKVALGRRTRPFAMR